MKASLSSHTTHDTLRKHVEVAIGDYFKKLDGHSIGNLYELVLTEVEIPLLRAVLSRAKQNQSQAAKILGINRATLRKKLLQHGLISEDELL